METDSAPPPPTSQLTEEESAIYDRQIRIWGVEAQTRMRSSSVLVLSFSGLSCELCKNLVLTGVGSLTLHDTAACTVTDLSSNFFLTAADIGHNRAQAALPRLQELNPNVQCRAVTAPLDSLDAAFFHSFSAVVVTEQPLAFRLHLSRTLRASPTPPAFFSCDLHRARGLLLTDLVQHHYVAQVKVDDPRSGLQSEASMQTGEQNYPPFERVVAMGEEEVRRQFGKRRVDKEGAAVYAEMMARLKGEGGGERGAYVSAVCAIFGGVIAQDVLKVLSGKEEPHQNTVVFDAINGIALVKSLQPDK